MLAAMMRRGVGVLLSTIQPLTHYALHTPTAASMGDALDDGFEAYDLEVDTEEIADDDEVSFGKAPAGAR